jgi:mannose-6-phosphate isomerase-like protein (cupin superfamily)
MNRNSFLKFSLAIGSAVSAPLSLLAKPFAGKRINKGIKVDAGKDRFGEEISLFEGDKFYCKVSTSDSDGDLYIFESTRDKKGGPPFHYHYDQDEWWYIIEGDFLFKVGDETFTARAGDSVFGPRMVPHAFAKMNDGNARMLIGFQPAGKMEEFFKKVSKAATKNMTEDERVNFRKDHGFVTVGPALTFLKQ